MKTRNQILLFVTVAVATCAIGTAQACEDGMHVDYGGQSCYEGWNDCQRAQPPLPVTVCPDWHDETPGALAEHCPLVQAPAAPANMPDWYDEAPRQPPTALSAPPVIGIEDVVTEADEGTLVRRASD